MIDQQVPRTGKSAIFWVMGVLLWAFQASAAPKPVESRAVPEISLDSPGDPMGVDKNLVAVAQAAGACSGARRGMREYWCRAPLASPRTEFVMTRRVHHVQALGLAKIDVLLDTTVGECNNWFVLAMGKPQVYFDEWGAWIPRQEKILLSLDRAVDPDKVGSVLFRFSTTGLWHARDVWGVRVKHLQVLVRDTLGTVIAEGTVLKEEDVINQ